MQHTGREKGILDAIRAACMRERTALAGRKVVLFGSRAQGNARERSDFDIGIDGPAPLDTESYSRLFDRIEGIETLYRIDLVDLQSVTGRFRDNALQQCEVIFE